MAAARSLNPSISVPSRCGVMDGPQHRGGPEDTGFLKRSAREEAAKRRGKNLGTRVSGEDGRPSVIRKKPEMVLGHTLWQEIKWL